MSQKYRNSFKLIRNKFQYILNLNFKSFKYIIYFKKLLKLLKIIKLIKYFKKLSLYSNVHKTYFSILRNFKTNL